MAVVGGSLAGAAAATVLARSGARVVVLEKAQFPRNKVCGCFLSHEAFPALRRMGIEEEELRKVNPEAITRFTLVQSSGEQVDAALPSPVLSISRHRLDALVSAAAESAPAPRFASAPSVLFVEGNLSKGFVVRLDGQELHARAVVGAWGRYSPLDSRLGRSFLLRESSSLFGFGKTFAGKSDHLANRAVCISSKGDTSACLASREGSSISPRWPRAPWCTKRTTTSRAFWGASPGRAPRSREISKGLTPTPGPPLVSEPMFLGEHGALAGDVLCVGDAAGVIDPYTGPECRSRCSSASRRRTARRLPRGNPRCGGSPA